MTASPTLEEALARAIDDARAEWPGLAIDEARFADFVRQRLAGPPAATLGALKVADLRLAFACAERNSAALDHVERMVLPGLRSALERFGYGGAQADEGIQALRTQLFVDQDGRGPGILRYSGSGSLAGWMRVVAGHLASRLQRSPSGVPNAGPAVVDMAGLGDPELELFARTYGDAANDALRDALAKLDVKERLLLQQRYRSQLDLEELARLHRVDASTISRRLAKTRELLATSTRDLMMARLGLSASEARSVIRLVESRLELSLSMAEARSPS